jgi:hypothetical protein
LIPNTFPKLICKFTQEINRDDRLHVDCVCENYRNPILSSVFRTKHFDFEFHLIESLLKIQKNGATGVCVFVHHVSVSIVTLVKWNFVTKFDNTSISNLILYLKKETMSTQDAHIHSLKPTEKAHAKVNWKQ